MTGLPAVEELRHAAGDGAVGEGQEHRLGIVGDVVPDLEVARGEVRVDVRDGVALALTPDQAVDRDVGVERQEPDQLRADVPGGPDDGGLDLAVSREGASAPVRRDRRVARSRAHWRARPLSGGGTDHMVVGRIEVTG